MIASITSSKSLSNSLPLGSRWRGVEITHQQVDTAIDRLIRWWWGAESPGLLLAGGCGAGKTTLADMVLGWAIARNIPSKFYSEPDLLDTIRESYGRKQTGLVQRLAETPLLILDDIGAGYAKADDWYQEIYWLLLDPRNRPGYRTLITTNLMPEPFKTRIGVRAASRLRELVPPDFVCLMFDVPDYRPRLRPARPLPEFTEELVAA